MLVALTENVQHLNDRSGGLCQYRLPAHWWQSRESFPDVIRAMHETASEVCLDYECRGPTSPFCHPTRPVVLPTSVFFGVSGMIAAMLYVVDGSPHNHGKKLDLYRPIVAK